MENKVNEFTNERFVECIYGKKIDCLKPPIERMIDLVKDVRNPNLICIDEYQVEIVFNDGGRTIQDCVQEALIQVNEKTF